MHLLSGSYLFSDTVGTPSGYFLALTIAFAIIFIAGAVAYWRRAKLSPQNPVLRRLIRRAASAAMWTCGLGLFFALMRYTNFPYLSDPIFMLLLVESMVVIVGYYVYDLSERYPIAIHRLQTSHIERRYRPMSKPRSEPRRQRAKARGKRRR